MVGAFEKTKTKKSGTFFSPKIILLKGQKNCLQPQKIILNFFVCSLAKIIINFRRTGCSPRKMAAYPGSTVREDILGEKKYPNLLMN